MKRETPAEREIVDLIAKTYEGWTKPDPRRLAAIEQRLLERPRRGAGIARWWLAAALVAGAASALWWAVDYDSDEGQKELVPAVAAPTVAPSTADPSTRPSRSEDAESIPAAEPAQKKGPVIYRKEQ